MYIRANPCSVCGESSYYTAQWGTCSDCKAKLLRKDRERAGFFELKAEIEELKEELAEIKKIIKKPVECPHCTNDQKPDKLPEIMEVS